MVSEKVSFKNSKLTFLAVIDSDSSFNVACKDWAENYTNCSWQINQLFQLFI